MGVLLNSIGGSEAGVADVSVVAGETVTAGQVVYLALGSIGETVGRCYLTDSDYQTRSAESLTIGCVVTGGAAAATVTVRHVGIVTGLSGLTPGAKQYVASTPGGLTESEPGFSKLVGTAITTTTMLLNTLGGENARKAGDTFFMAGGTGGISTVRTMVITSLVVNDTYGTLTLGRLHPVGTGSTTRVICSSGQVSTTAQTVIDYNDPAAGSTFAVFGALTAVKRYGAGASNQIKSLVWGGMGSGGGAALTTNIDDFLNATLANAASFGVLSRATIAAAGASNPVYAYDMGGATNSGSTAWTASIDVITIASAAGGGTDCGDLTYDRTQLAGAGSATRILATAGWRGGAVYSDIIEYFSPSTSVTVSDFGDLLAGNAWLTAGSNGVTAVIVNVTEAQTVTIATLGNAVTVGAGPFSAVVSEQAGHSTGDGGLH